MTNHIASLLGGFETGGRLIVHTHYIPAMAPPHPRDGELQRAVCGQYALASEKHSLEPTCQNCVRLLSADENAHRAPGYTLGSPYPEIERIVTTPLATTPCLDGSTERCVPMATSDGMRCVYCRREIIA